jgi:PKHD-type hydroxylase
MIYEYDFFDRNQLRQMISLFDAGKFVDGSASGPKDKNIKDNTQQDDIDINKMVNSGIAKIMRESSVCKYHPLNKCSPSLLLKYEEGQHYGDHTDFFEMWGSRTDYTAVINLNDDYEGGEHYINIGTETIERKLEPGKLLIYPTEFIHGVRPITSGVRKCITFWIESSVADPMMRYYITELNKVYEKINGDLDRETLTQLDLARMGIIRRSSIFRN